MSCYTEPFMFVDVAAPGWSIMHISDALTEQTGEPLHSPPTPQSLSMSSSLLLEFSPHAGCPAGITRDDIETQKFWDIFGHSGHTAVRALPPSGGPMHLMLHR